MQTVPVNRGYFFRIILHIDLNGVALIKNQSWTPEIIFIITESRRHHTRKIFGIRRKRELKSFPF